jgi:ABC-type branched-subunit amino acid transport system substrate-binding protein
MRSKTLLTGVVLIGLLGFFASACSSGSGSHSEAGSGSQSGGSGDSQFKVLLLTSMSGADAAIGQAFEAATKAGVEVVNADGGADGRTMTLTVIDDASDPQAAVSAVQNALASGTQYNLIIPGIIGTIAAAVVPTLVDNPALQMSSAASVDDPQKYPRWFSTTPSVNNLSASMIAYAKSKGYTHLGVMAIDNPTGRAFLAAYQTAAKAAGVTLDEALVPATEAVATSEWQQLIAKHVDAVMLTGFDATGASASIIKAKVELGVTLPIIADNTFGANQLQAAGITAADLKGIELQSTTFTVAGTPESSSLPMKQAMDALAKYSGGKVLPVQISTIQILTVLLAADAATAAHSVDGSVIAKKLNSVTGSELQHWFGPAGQLFTPVNHTLQFAPQDFIFFPMTFDTNAEGFKIQGTG